MSSTKNKNAILKALSSVLLPLAFSRKGSAFTRKINDVTQVVSFQRSSKSTKELLVATLNLGVYSSVVGQDDNPAGLDVWSCHWKARLGELTPAGDDMWWDIDSEACAAQTAEEICAMVADYGLPALDSHDSTAKMLDLWKRGEYGGLTEKQRLEFIALAEAGLVK